MFFLARILVRNSFGVVSMRAGYRYLAGLSCFCYTFFCCHLASLLSLKLENEIVFLIRGELRSGGFAEYCLLCVSLFVQLIQQF